MLRPDWEREGRVYGLRMPRERTAERAFEYLVDYPCEFEIKVIGINEGSFADDIAATVSAVCEVSWESLLRFAVGVSFTHLQDFCLDLQTVVFLFFFERPQSQSSRLLG